MSAALLVRSLLAAGLALTLSGCFLEDGSGQATTLYITPSLGVVRHATVLVKAGDTPATAVTVALGDTGDGGTAAVRVRGAGPYIVEVVGDDEDAVYVDELKGQRALPAGVVLRALVPAGRTATAVTPLTEAAYQFLAESGAPLTVANVTAANNAVRAALAPGVIDILSIPMPWTDLPANDSYSGSQSEIHALAIAAMVRMPMYSGQTTPALALLEDLQADIGSDGELDGLGGTAAIAYFSRAALQAELASTVDLLGTQLLDNGIEDVVLAVFEPADYTYVAPEFTGLP